MPRCFAVAVLAASACAQDVVTLKDGRVLVGTWNPVNLTMTLDGPGRRVVPVELYQIAAVARRPDPPAPAPAPAAQGDVVRLKDGRVLVGVFNPLTLSVAVDGRQAVPVELYQIAAIEPAPIPTAPPAAPGPPSSVPPPAGSGCFHPLATAVVLSSWILLPFWRHHRWWW